MVVAVKLCSLWALCILLMMIKYLMTLIKTCSSPVVRGGRTWDVLAVADIPAWGLIHCSRSSREGSEILDGNRANGYSTGSGEEVEEGKVDILSTRF
ncbi:hypothetical protein I3842_03G048900 [Carya illinoinensis]|uniref:Uncharacterized protein n=1 Tax=Carya illinoinensis TaxID=32201 RepID=A0A922FH89_CARIL|nr:hypothetical protein I3842_03G048900 [Carya illinoinensis]